MRDMLLQSKGRSVERRGNGSNVLGTRSLLATTVPAATFTIRCNPRIPRDFCSKIWYNGNHHGQSSPLCRWKRSAPHSSQLSIPVMSFHLYPPKLYPPRIRPADLPLYPSSCCHQWSILSVNEAHSDFIDVGCDRRDALHRILHAEDEDPERKRMLSKGHQLVKDRIVIKFLQVDMSPAMWSKMKTPLKRLSPIHCPRTLNTLRAATHPVPSSSNVRTKRVRSLYQARVSGLCSFSASMSPLERVPATRFAKQCDKS